MAGEFPYPYDFEVRCERCGVRFGSHTGTHPYWWCPGYPKNMYGDEDTKAEWIAEKRFFSPVHDRGYYPRPPTAEERYEALSNGS